MSMRVFSATTYCHEGRYTFALLATDQPLDIPETARLQRDVKKPGAPFRIEIYEDLEHITIQRLGLFFRKEELRTAAAEALIRKFFGSAYGSPRFTFQRVAHLPDLDKVYRRFHERVILQLVRNDLNG